MALYAVAKPTGKDLMLQGLLQAPAQHKFNYCNMNQGLFQPPRFGLATPASHDETRACLSPCCKRVAVATLGPGVGQPGGAHAQFRPSRSAVKVPCISCDQGLKFQWVWFPCVGFSRLFEKVRV